MPIFPTGYPIVVTLANGDYFLVDASGITSAITLANLLTLVPASGMRRLSHEENTIALVNVQTNAVIRTTAIPANTIGASGSIEWNLYGIWAPSGGAIIHIKCTFGGSTLFDADVQNTGCLWKIVVKVVNTATNAQRVIFEWHENQGVSAAMAGSYTALAIDTTANQNLEALWSNNGNGTFTKYLSEVILIP